MIGTTAALKDRTSRILESRIQSIRDQSNCEPSRQKSSPCYPCILSQYYSNEQEEDKLLLQHECAVHHFINEVRNTLNVRVPNRWK